MDYIVHDDETIREDLTWCPNCGYNAYILTWETEIGIRYRCICGLTGRFGDGLEEPTTGQYNGPEKEEDY